MNRRERLKLTGVTTGVVLASPLLAEGQKQTNAAGARSPDKLNILLIVTDQERSFQDIPDALHLPGDEGLIGSGVSIGNYQRQLPTEITNDTQQDPDEINNLAHQPQIQKVLLTRLNQRTNGLIPARGGHGQR